MPWGGKRKGAGRPARSKRISWVRIQSFVERETYERMAKEAETKGLSLSKYVAEILESSADGRYET